MKLADAVIVCVKVLRMPVAAVALAYGMPVAEVEEIARDAGVDLSVAAEAPAP